MALNNLFGDLGLDGTLQKMAVSLTQIAQNIGKWYPNSSGQMPVVVANGTISTVTNLQTVGGINMQYDQYCQMQAAANGVRAQITTS